MPNEIVGLIENSRLIEGLISDVKKNFLSQIEGMHADISALITIFEEIQTSLAEKSQTKGEHELKLTNLTSELANLQNIGQKSEEKSKELTKQRDGLQKNLAAFKKDNVDLKEQIESVTLYVKKSKEKLATTKTDITTLKGQIQQEKTTQVTTIKEIQEQMDIIQKETEVVKSDHAVLDLILEETSVEIPEVDIMGALLSKSEKRMNLNELKNSISVSPVVINRTIKQLEQAGIVKFNEDTKEISF